MRPPKETKDEKFRRLAEARVNKILHLFRLLGNLSWTANYSYTRDQVEQIFTTLQLELVKTKVRFLQDQEKSRSVSPWVSRMGSMIRLSRKIILLLRFLYLTVPTCGLLVSRASIIPASTSIGITVSTNRRNHSVLLSSIPRKTAIRRFVSESTVQRRKTPYIMDRTLR